MYNNNFSNEDVLPTIAKVAAGQAIDKVSPEAGFIYHTATTLTAKNPVDLFLGIFGMLQSTNKIVEQQKRNT